MTQHTDTDSDFNPIIFMENMVKVGELWQQIALISCATRLEENTQQSLDPMHLRDAWMDVAERIARDPARMMDIQTEMWQDYFQFWQHTTKKMLGQTAEDYIRPATRDRRFRDIAWDNSFIFDTLKQCYLMANKWAMHSLNEARPSNKHHAAKLDFFTRHFLDAMSPSNFFSTNPEVMRAAIESNGASIVKGLTNLLEDIERGGGKLAISTTDYNAFELGKNIACTPGKVVFKNDLIELIQYKPATDKVFKTPLLIIPAWINKYYILDLKPENSFIKWATEQGHSVFVISWVNPDAKTGRKGFEDYMREGPIAALDAIKLETGESSVNTVGYCLGGTLLSATLAYLHHTQQSTRIKSATYLTTLVDFSECGELGVFIDDSQLAAMEKRMSEAGYLDGREMATSFNMLRANDMIWSFVINNYLLGKDPFPFDLLYWNADATRMPANAHSYYLRNMYQANKLVIADALTMCDAPINLSEITTPSYILSTREDHIAPWRSTYAATQIYSGDTTFTLAGSGHVAGVISSPAKNKYNYWSNDALPTNPEEWLAGAEEQHGSWWLHWQEWITQHTGKKVPARAINKNKKNRKNAPGDYARQRA